MITQTRAVSVGRPLREVYAALSDATLWSVLTPSHHGDQVYEVKLRDRDQDLVFVHGPEPGALRTILARKLYPERRIEVRYLRYKWPVRDLKATWSISASEHGTEVRLDYQMRIAWLGDWFGRRLILPLFYGKNTEAVLHEMRDRLEARADEAHDLDPVPSVSRLVGDRCITNSRILGGLGRHPPPPHSRLTHPLADVIPL